MKERGIKEHSVVQRHIQKKNKFKPVVLFFLQRPTPEKKKRDPRFSFSKLKGRPHSLRTAGLNRDEQHKQKPVLKQALSYTHGKKEPSELKATFAPQSHTDSPVSNLCWAD